MANSFQNRQCLGSKIAYCGTWWDRSHNKQCSQPHEIIELPLGYQANAKVKIAEMYQSGLSIGEIAKRTRISKTKVLKTLKQSDVTTRSYKKSHSNKPDPTTAMRPGATPYGFCYLEGKLVVDTREYQVVLNISRMWKSGMSYRAIARRLNDQGVPTRKAKLWKHEVVKTIVERHDQMLIRTMSE